jgi:PAS domain-containing protein
MNASVISLVSLVLNLLLGGGLVAVWLRYRVQVRNEDRVDFSTLLSAVERQRDEAWAHIERQDDRIRHLEDEVQGLRIARDLDPFPNWLTDLDGRYTFVNRPFEELFLEPQRKTRRDVIGKTHEEFWPEPFCRTLASLNAAARKRPDGTARANTTLDIPGLGACQVTVHKFPCRIKGVVVASAGYITVVEPENTISGLPEKNA